LRIPLSILCFVIVPCGVPSIGWMYGCGGASGISSTDDIRPKMPGSMNCALSGSADALAAYSLPKTFRLSGNRPERLTR
jgi:hypothetical protein